MNATKIHFVAFFLSALALGGCAGQLYKVATPPASPPPVISTNNASGLNAGAVVLDGDLSIEQFEANLPLAGVVPIDVKLSNQSSNTIDLKKLRFELGDGAKTKFKQIGPQQALSRVIGFYGDSFYRVDARKRTQENYLAIALKLERPLDQQEERRGFLFFESKSQPVKLDGLILSIKGAAIPINIQLNGKTDK